MNKIPNSKNCLRFSVPASLTQQRPAEFLQPVPSNNEGFSSFRTDLNEMFERLGDTYRKNTSFLIESFSDKQKKEYSSTVDELTNSSNKFAENVEMLREKLSIKGAVDDVNQLVQSVVVQQRKNSKKITEDIRSLEKILQKLGVKPTKRRNSSPKTEKTQRQKCK